MPQWLKNLTLILVLLAWSVTIIERLRAGELPDATFLGVPILAMTALAPPIRIGRGREADERRSTAADDEQEATET